MAHRLPIAEYPNTGGGDLAGTRWRVWAYRSDGEIVYHRPGEPTMVLQFGHDGTISGTGGCNDYQARYEVSGEYKSSGGGPHVADEGQLIAFNDFTSTQTVCASPQAMAAEAAYFAALQEAGRWSIQSDRELNLSTTDNTDLIGARPQPEE